MADTPTGDAPPGSTPPQDARRATLTADCAKCCGLCCVAPAFLVSSDFAIDKGAGQPCPNLERDFRCGIHPKLRESGFPGCVVYECFGAGQRVTQVTFDGTNWRTKRQIAARMFEVFFVVRRLHELLWYLTEALALPEARPLQAELQAAFAETDDLAGGNAEALSELALAELDLADHWQRVNELLRKASALARAASRGPALDRRGADLIGADLRAIDLRGAELRGAQLIAADLRFTSLALADLTGADLRGADLSGANLGGALFLTQSQIESARGDRATKLPPTLTRPAHWG
ncbi:MAG TPA: pentapeptide repeat-containing protein [Candidatus Limnocylindrales bacterium]